MKAMLFSKQRRNPGWGRTATIWAGCLVAGAGMVVSAAADEYHATATPGGVQVQPTIKGFTVVSGSNAFVDFQGLQAPYLILVSSNFTDWTEAGMTSIKSPAYTGRALATNVPSGVAGFRMMMLGTTNWVGKWNTSALRTNSVFVGAGKCTGCHSDKVAEWAGTPHATAVNRLINSNGVLNGVQFGTECIRCHSVGYGQPGGFKDMTNTAHLASVGCETCHGSGSAHVNIGSRLYKPVDSLAPEICGGCHEGSHHPTYEEWETSRHAEVTPDVSFGVPTGTFTNAVLVTNGVTWKGYIINTNGTYSMAAGMYHSTNEISGYNRQMQCGFCHSGATRMAMLKEWEDRQKGLTNALALPSGLDASETGATCAVCHDPHSDKNVAQLRNPTRSTNYYTLFTGSRPAITNYSTNVIGLITTNVAYMNDGFASQYNPNVQVCAQCHNSRGARWDGRSFSWVASSNAMVLTTNQSFSRPPHHSPQYNVLIGILQPDYFNTNSSGVATNWMQRHGTSASSSTGAYNTNQCATCHVPSYSVSSTTNVTGHKFAMDIKGCTVSGCHSSVPNYEEAMVTTTNSITRIVGLLNKWAVEKGAGLGLTKGADSWDYTTTGALAPTPRTANAGPSSSQQLLIPDAVKQARYNLYMVLHDGSLGVHNPRYVNALLADAESKVLAQYTLANFKASVATGYAPLTTVFTNLGTNVTTYSWNFGDGNTSTEANPTNVYAAAGAYTVTLTATGAGTETVIRSNYITVVDKPTVSFTGDSTNGAAPLTVNFSNTSTSTNSVTAWRWTTSGTNLTSTNFATTVNASFTYTNAGTYNVLLRASTAAGSVTQTNNAYIVVTP